MESRDMTPRQWPQGGGFLDDAAWALRRSARFEWLRRGLRRLGQVLTPQGVVSVQLAVGQSLALEGGRQARLECLEGQVWATGDGLDRLLRQGEASWYPVGAKVVVTARERGARVRLGWK